MPERRRRPGATRRARGHSTPPDSASPRDPPSTLDSAPLLDAASPLDSAAIDALYGLEPVYEPGIAGGDATGFVAVECPYCWETYDTPVDLSAGAFEHVEDCQVCCQPIELAVDVGDDGGVSAVRATRLQ